MYNTLSVSRAISERLIKISLAKVRSLNLFSFSYANFCRAKIIKSQDTLGYKLLIEFNSTFELIKQ